MRLTDNLSQDGGAREKIAMVPYADLINHSPFSRSFIASRLTPGKIMWEKTDPGLDEEVIIYADRPVRKMEQIYVNYGEKSSSDFMLFYGFGGGESNPFNSVDVTIGILPPKEGGDEQTLALFDKKIAFLKQMDAPLVADFPVYSDRYPTEMLEYCRLMLLTTEECEKKENLDEFDFTKPVGRDNEARVLMSVIRACKVSEQSGGGLRMTTNIIFIPLNSLRTFFARRRLNSTSTRPRRSRTRPSLATRGCLACWGCRSEWASGNAGGERAERGGVEEDEQSQLVYRREYGPLLTPSHLLRSAQRETLAEKDSGSSRARRGSEGIVRSRRGRRERWSAVRRVLQPKQCCKR